MAMANPEEIRPSHSLGPGKTLRDDSRNQPVGGKTASMALGIA
jgi:hypothetical protein